VAASRRELRHRDGIVVVPHAKCLRCHARVWRRSLADLCPGCGGDLLDAQTLAELVGLRSLGTPRPSDGEDPTARFERISQQIRDAIARHDAERARHGGAGPTESP
jgi:hypothetical protein